MDKLVTTGDIWIFVEDSLRTEVPTYIKYVLMACGYSNAISISAIGEDDLNYIQDEVRNGNVGKVFNDSAVDYLDGCSKSAEEFEFVRGHEKFLKAIVGFLKKYVAENGLGSFSVGTKNEKKIETISKKIEEKALKKSKEKVDKLIPLIDKMKFEKLDVESESRISGPKTVTVDHSNSTILPLVAHQVLESEIVPSGEDSPTNEGHRIDDIVLKPGCFVIYCMSLKDWIHWPDVKPPVKYFVGQFRLLEDPGRTNGHLEIELVGLRKNPYRRQNFCCPENHETIKVSKKNIVKILPNPTMNRRGEFVFEDKSILDYTFD